MKDKNPGHNILLGSNTLYGYGRAWRRGGWGLKNKK
jgi:hypothetical protein